MSPLEATLMAAALLAGLTGTWSPCGFSMIETIGPVGHRSGRATTAAACVTFAAGALAGGVATFAAMAALGRLAHGAGGEVAYGIAAAIAIVAALLEARGAPIVPQVRRQVPEHWRRVLPMPLAAGLYGILLGLGFTTFVLTFGVFALAAIAFAVGDPAVGALLGLAFGAGRALPVVAIAPLAARPLGIRATALMAERPEILRGLRAGDAVALAASAVVLISTVPAGAARVDQQPAADPAVGGEAMVFQLPDRTGVIERGGERQALPGRDPAIGGGRVTVIRNDRIVVLSAADLGEVGSVPAAGADAVAISGTWLVWRARSDGRDVLRARRLADASSPGPVHLLGVARGAAQIGRPSLDGNRLVYARAEGGENVIVRRTLGARRHAKSTVMRSVTAGLSSPSIHGAGLLYVRSTARRDELRLARLGGGRGRVLLTRGPRRLWSTALTATRAYVTEISGTAPQQRILSVKR